ncbi:MAG TPA: pentapeptide repeat-containing protein [Bryobacteraceae bacterium]|nr:pentapeptide repeat-containing protein [Bryobacteraceae bacterium]
MLVRELRPRPPSWSQYKEDCSPAALPFHALEWLLQWSAYFLSRWALLEVLEYLSVLSVLFAVVFYFAESGDRQKQKHYQAWQVINTAQGKGGSGGRIEALQELNLDRVPLVGVNAAGAFLQGIQLPHANLLRANLQAADLRDSNLQAVDLRFASLRSANFRQANLSRAKLEDADLTDADLVGAELRGADLRGAILENADLRDVNLAGAQWQNIANIKNANIHGVRTAPEGFAAWAIQHKAVSLAGEE